MKITNKLTKENWSNVQFPLFAKRDGKYGYYVFTFEYTMLFIAGEEYIDITKDFIVE